MKRNPSPPLSRLERIAFGVPLLGWMLKDVIYGDPANKWWALVAVVSLWIMAIMTWGFPAVVVPVVAAVPVAFAILLVVTRG